MSAKAALIWVSVSIAIIVILYISYIIYKKFIAKHFDESARQQQPSNEMPTSQPVTASSYPLFNLSSNTTGPSAPSYSQACQPPLAPPSYEEAISHNK